MGEIENWISGEKVFFKKMRSLLRSLPPFGLKASELPPFSLINYSYCLKSFFKKKADNTTSSSLKVPSTDGTFSFPEQKIAWFWKVSEIPSAKRAGLIRLIKNNRNKIFLNLIFSPRSFNQELAEESDFYLIRKNKFIPRGKELDSIYKRMRKRVGDLPLFPPNLSFMERNLIRLLWRFRFNYLELDKITDYLHGNRLSRNIRATEVSISKIRKKLKKFYFEAETIDNKRFLGYKLSDELLEKIFLLQGDSAFFSSEKARKAIRTRIKGNIW